MMDWAELPAKVKTYILILSGFATLISAWALSDLVSSPFNTGWVVLTLLVLLTVPFYLFLPSANTVVGIGDAYVMAIAMMYGVAPCIAATFLQTLIISIFAQNPKRYSYKIVFNTASSICGAWLYGSVYRTINRGSVQLGDIVVSAAVLVATYFFTNSILTSIAVAWSRGEGVIKFWTKACVPLAVEYSVSSVYATIIVAFNYNKFIPLAVAPFLGVIWGWDKLHKNREMQAQKHIEEQEQLYLRTVESLALAVDAKDQTTYGHIRRVKVYAMGLAKLCGIKDQNKMKAIETGSLLHDIGKIAIDDYILNKPGRLSQKEFEKVKMHAAAGDEILQQVCFPFPVAKYVRYHHERWDGLGYPDGVKGEAIPLGARILAIADAFDAIRFSRPYKLSVATEEAIEILRNQAGTVYDPNLVKIFSDHIRELEQAAIRESANAPQLSFRKYTETNESPAQISPSSSTIVQDVPAELVQLAELCSTISGYLQLKDILPIISKRLEQLVPFSTGIFYLNKGDDRISAIYVSGIFSEILQNQVMEMGKGISGWVAAYRKPMINTGPMLDFQNFKGDFTSYTDVLVVPVLEGDECLGTISLYAQKPISYSQHDLIIVQTVASLLAPLISEAKKNGISESQDMFDQITRMHRISYLTTLGPQLISSAIETRTPISLIYLEIRNLGQIIRVFGSHLGNSIIKRVAECIKPELRETDILVRYGHQGFIAFLPGVRNDQALRCAQRLKQQIKAGAFAPGQGFTIDCQAGVSFCPKDGSTVLDLLQSAQKTVRSGSTDRSEWESNVVDFHRA
jgi:diguanylate cyclase (GGDEF)-like protein/putative nucleotidyltransferase with HDIG domain